MRELERRVVLSVIDRRWRDHLYEMDYLKDGIGLRAMAQRDPLVEYQREGFSLFQNMMGQIREESIGFLFNLEVEVTSGGGATASLPTVEAKGLGAGSAPAERLSYSAPSDSGGVEVRNQRGQLEQAATAKAQQAAAAQANEVSAAFGGQPQQPAPQQGQDAGGQRGAFGQRQAPPSGQQPPQNRAQRRAQERNKRH
jgi:preprotein translocase subunit SecA